MSLSRFIPIAIIVMAINLGIIYLVVKIVRMAWGS
jgi:hypothetical protein